MFQAVPGRIQFRIFYGIGDQLDTDNLFRAVRQENTDAAGTAIQVVHHFITGKPSKVAGNTVQLFRLTGIGLKEGFGRYLKAERLKGILQYSPCPNRFPP